ncbi:FliA/WhiG family RNA polymerase sigma factor [bacterium]|nr:FliA/WhiG family RNA polymerase sigma factor [bacterium]
MSEESSNYNNIKRISDEELEKLWMDYFADHDNKKLRDALIVQYIYLTRYVIGRIKIQLPPSFSIEDIASYGVEGLIDSIEKYTPDKGTKFESYALIRIRGNILDKIRSQNWLPRTQRKKIKEIKDTAEQLKQSLGRNPTFSEIGEVLGIEKEKIEAVLSDDTTVISIYEKRGQQEDSNEIIDTIQDEKKLNPQEEFVEKETRQELQTALSRLPERERAIMILYYHENMTLKDIGEAINISESRVCQLHAQAIMKLRSLLSAQRSERIRKLRKSILGYSTKSK